MWQNLQLYNPVSREDLSDDSTAEDVQSAKRFFLTCFKRDKKLLASLAGAEATVLVRQSIPGTGNEAHWAFVGIRDKNYSKAIMALGCWGASGRRLGKAVGSQGSKSAGKTQSLSKTTQCSPQSPSQDQHVLLELSNKDERNIS